MNLKRLTIGSGVLTLLIPLIGLSGCGRLIGVGDTILVGDRPWNDGMFCDMETSRRCATADDIAMGTDIANPVFNAGTAIGLDYSAAARGQCNDQPQAVLFHGPFPKGSLLCVNGPQTVEIYGTMEAACRKYCTVTAGVDDCERTHASHGAAEFFPGACNDGQPRADWVDPRFPAPLAPAKAPPRRTALSSGTGPARPLVLDAPEGRLKIDLDIDDPLGTVRERTRITSGRLQILPAEGIDVPEGKQFLLTEGVLRFEDFTYTFLYVKHIHHRQIGVSVRKAVWFTGVPTGTPGEYAFSIPGADVTINGSAVVNGTHRFGDDEPNQPVTGTINLNTGLFTARIVMDRSVTLLDVPIVGDVDAEGTLTVEVSGHLSLPDADGDGVPDRIDNCPLVANGDQAVVESPVITTPADVTVASCTSPAIGQATARDVCRGKAVRVTNDAPSVFPLGSRTVTWTATDSEGHTAMAGQRVNVEDRTLPAFTFVPAPITVTACGAVDLQGPARARDDCGGTTVTHDAPASFPPGPTTVTWSARDVSGNVATAAQIVTVNDTTPPAFTQVPPPITITTCVAAAIGQAQASDACGVTITNDAPAKFPLGPTTVTWSARDSAGNVGQVTQRVTAELGDDATCCPSGAQIMVGTSGSDTLLGRSGRECILGRGGDDIIDGGDGGDFISGGAGRDTIAGGPGNDLVNGRDGDDVLDGGTGDDALNGGPGFDSCAGGTGANTLKGCEVRSGG